MKTYEDLTNPASSGKYACARQEHGEQRQNWLKGGSLELQRD